MMNHFRKKDLIKLECDAYGIANLQMLDVAGKNSLSPDFVESLIHYLQEIKNNEEIKVLLISGTSDIFCSGADLDTIVKLCKKEIKPVDIILSKMLLDIPIPVISAMEGHAIGGGLALGLCADIAILAEESRYGCSFINKSGSCGIVNIVVCDKR